MKALATLLIIVSLLLSSACTADERLEDAAYFSFIDSDTITLGGAPLLIPAYGELYASESSIVEITEADTTYIFTGKTTLGESLGFSSNGLGKLTYTDVTTNRVALINTALTISIPEEDTPAVVRCYVYKNGIADPASLVGDYLISGDVVEALPIVCLIEILETGDYFELGLQSNATNVTVTVATMTLIVTTVD